MALSTKKLAELADSYNASRIRRLAKQKEVEALAEDEKELKQKLIDGLLAGKATGIAGKTVNASIVYKDIIQVEDWDAYYANILKSKSFDLLQKRVNDAAVKARLEDGKKVPGIKIAQVITISLEKV